MSGSDSPLTLTRRPRLFLLSSPVLEEVDRDEEEEVVDGEEVSIACFPRFEERRFEKGAKDQSSSLVCELEESLAPQRVGLALLLALGGDWGLHNSPEGVCCILLRLLSRVLSRVFTGYVHRAAYLFASRTTVYEACTRKSSHIPSFVVLIWELSGSSRGSWSFRVVTTYRRILTHRRHLPKSWTVYK